MPDNDEIDDAPNAWEPHADDPDGAEPPLDGEPDEAPHEAEPPPEAEPQPDPVDEPPPAAPRAPVRAPSVREKSSSPFPFFAAALLFALLAQPLAAGVLVILNSLGVVDFSAVDQSEGLGALILGVVFVLEIALLAVAGARSGFNFGRIFGALLALGASLGMLLMFYVALGCWLYDNCL